MQYICDAPGGKTWFRIETEGEALAESAAMHHAVEKYFRRERERAVQCYAPQSNVFIEQEIGLKAHLLKVMPHFLTLRDDEGTPLATAMLPPGGRESLGFRPVIVGDSNSDPYPAQGEAIRALGAHYRMALEHDRCFPYGRPY